MTITTGLQSALGVTSEHDYRSWPQIEKAAALEIEKAVTAERTRCHDIALAIDSGRGNEKFIAQSILTFEL